MKMPANHSPDIVKMGSVGRDVSGGAMRIAGEGYKPELPGG
jgi:hypothetical protein